MSVDDRENRSDKPADEQTREHDEIVEALHSKTDEPIPPRAAEIANRDARLKHPHTPQGRRRRYLNKRNALIAGIAASIGVIALILLAFLLRETGPKARRAESISTEPLTEAR